MDDVIEARITSKNKKIINIQKTMRIIIWSFVPVMLLTLGLAWAFYPEPWEFVDEFVSNLGNTVGYHTKLDNTVSMFIMTIGFSVIGLCCLAVAILYFVRPGMRYQIIKTQDPNIRILKSERGLLYAVAKGVFYFIMFLGALGIAVPGDIESLFIFHITGASLFLVSFGLVNFIHQSLRFLRKVKAKDEKKKIDFYLDIVMVVLVFAVLLTLGIIYIIYTAKGQTVLHPVLSPYVWQKMVLIINLVAIFFLDIDDM
jgi:hypothetical protein